MNRIVRLALLGVSEKVLEWCLTNQKVLYQKTPTPVIARQVPVRLDPGDLHGVTPLAVGEKKGSGFGVVVVGLVPQCDRGLRFDGVGVQGG